MKRNSMWHPTRVIALAAFIAIIPTATIQAQLSPWARGAGMAGANLALATGYHAMGLNPANLALATAPRWSFAIQGVQADASVAGTTVQDLADILSAGGDGDPSLLTGIPEEGLVLDFMADGFVVSRATGIAEVPDPAGGVPIPSLALTIGRFGLSYENRVIGQATMSREVTDLTVLGYNPERITEYSVGNTGFHSVSLSTLTAAAGWSSQDLSLGIAARGVLGKRLVQGRLFEPDIDLDDESMSISAIGIESPGAKGFGIDIGATYQPNQYVTMGFVIQNLVQRLMWDEDLLIYADDITDDDIDNSEAKDIIDRFQGEDLDPDAVPLLAYEAAEGLLDESFLPRIIRVGGAVSADWGGSLHVAYSAVHGAGRFYSPWDDRFSVGVEQRLPVLSLRGGFAAASAGQKMITAGLGLDVGGVNLDLMAGKISGTSDSRADFDGLMAMIGLSVIGR